jgi:magnesium-transporting ATPase (P-type)
MATGTPIVSSQSISRAIDLASTAIALLIVCIPEGMPLVISMAMAFSVDQLKKENLLIKNLDALETAGQVVDILTGKTATLTTGDMEVSRIHVIDQTFEIDSLQANMEVLKTLYDCIVLNCDAHMQMDNNNDYKPVGSPVEVGLLKMLIKRGIAVQEKLIEREREVEGENCYKLMSWIPFSSERKRMTVAFRLRENPNVVRVVVKGAPESIIPMCSTKLDSFNQPANFEGDGYEGQNYLERVIINDIIGVSAGDAVHPEDANTGLKSLTIAYRDFDTYTFE